jgi:hypothetical protein
MCLHHATPTEPIKENNSIISAQKLESEIFTWLANNYAIYYELIIEI